MRKLGSREAICFVCGSRTRMDGGGSMNCAVIWPVSLQRLVGSLRMAGWEGCCMRS